MLTASRVQLVEVGAVKLFLLMTCLTHAGRQEAPSLKLTVFSKRGAYYCHSLSVFSVYRAIATHLRTNALNTLARVAVLFNRLVYKPEATLLTVHRTIPSALYTVRIFSRMEGRLTEQVANALRLIVRHVYFKESSHKSPKATMRANTTIAIATLIQMGLSTHHQLQLITCVSFNPMNRMVSNAMKPVLLLLLFVCCAILVKVVV